MKNKEITISVKISTLLKSGIKVFPVFDNRHKWAVFIEDNYNSVYRKKKTLGDYKHTNKTLNIALENAINHIYMKLNKKQSA